MIQLKNSQSYSKWFNILTNSCTTINLCFLILIFDVKRQSNNILLFIIISLIKNCKRYQMDWNINHFLLPVTISVNAGLIEAPPTRNPSTFF